MVTTLRELTERFGGLEGSALDEFGRAHPISLAPFAAADPDTTAVGIAWSGRRRDAPPIPTRGPAPCLGCTGPSTDEVRHCLGVEATSSAKPVACAFCAEGVQYTDRDPIGIGVVEHWPPDEEGVDWMVYAHRACLLSRLTGDVRVGVDR